MGTGRIGDRKIKESDRFWKEIRKIRKVQGKVFDMNEKLKKRILRVAVGAAVYIFGILSGRYLPDQLWGAGLLLFLLAYAVIGLDVVKKAVVNIGKGQIFDENFLMTIATVGAFLVGDYSEAVAVMLFYQVGECFQSYAVGKSRKSIAELMNIRPDYANVFREGAFREVDPEEVAVGDTILVKPGEKIPLDGVVTEGSSYLDTMALTGESLPEEVHQGDRVVSGCVNQNGLLEILVEKEFGQSTVAKILELVENAGSKKAEAENFITGFAKYYTPVVVICAALLAILPPLLLGEGFGVWVYRALTFLVVSCPCALVISIPLSFFGGLGGASRGGILVKGSNYLEALADAGTVVMDKTGTLTKGNFVVSRMVPTDVSTEKELLEVAAYAESYSNHPISKSLLSAYAETIDQTRLSSVEEIAGHGVGVMLDGTAVYVGNSKLMNRQGISFPAAAEVGTVVYVARNGTCLGYIVIADEIKEDAKKAVDELKAAGMNIVMLTGDNKEAASYVAKQVGITQVYANLLPGDKVAQVEALLQADSAKNSKRGRKSKVIFVGDGINDAPVLARADIGIAMGGLGSDAAIEAADVVIMTDEPSKIAEAMGIARKTRTIVRQNIMLAMGVKVMVLLLAAAGYTLMWMAVFADVGVAVLAVLNAMRVMNLSLGKRKR